MKKLIIAEKPSVAKNICDALGGMRKYEGYFENSEYIVSFAYGHLYTLYDVSDYDSGIKGWKEEYFPYIPKIFRYKPIPRKGVFKQIKVLQHLVSRTDVTSIISACDYDREGQLIGDVIFKNLKPNQKIYRMLLNEWTKESVLEGLEGIIPNEEMLSLRDAGISRQWTDWVIGINLTSITTLRYSSSKVLNIGRVLLPTLKIIYDREEEILHFKPEEYFKLQGIFFKDNRAFEGIYFNKKDKFKNKKILEDIYQKITVPTEGIVLKKEQKIVKDYPPKLFNMTSLQHYIIRTNNNFNASKVLKIAQSLYEKKMITYPRTESEYLDESLYPKGKKTFNQLTENHPYKEKMYFSKNRIFNSSKVSSHSAIIPTGHQMKLSTDEITVYSAIKNRFLIQFMKPAEYEVVKLIIDVEGHMFHASGKVELEKGFKLLEKTKTKDRVLPLVNKGDKVLLKNININTNETKPPKYYTEGTLIKTMESCSRYYKDDDEKIKNILAGYSLGTSATRADIIRKLFKAEYIYAENKNLKVTKLGKNLIEKFPVKQFLDPEFTGRLEKSLQDISKGKLSKNEFLHYIFKLTSDSVETIKRHQRELLIDKEIIGICPECNHNIYEEKSAFTCSHCDFILYKNDHFLKSLKKKVSKNFVKKLLKEKKVYVKNLVSKKGNRFNAYLSYEKEDGKYTWKMDFNG